MAASPDQAVTGPLLPIRVAVSLAQLACVWGGLTGAGLIGMPIRDAADGAFRPEATLLAPALPAFGIWTVIYLALFVYTLWMWLPGRRPLGLIATTGWLAASSMLLNAVWIMLAQQGMVAAAAIILILLAGILLALLLRLDAIPPHTRVEWVVIDLPFGLYLGWVLVAAGSNVAAALARAGMQATGQAPATFAVLALAALGAIGVVLAYRFRGQWGLAAGLVWGLLWVAVARSHGEPRSMWVAVAAALTAAFVAGAFTQAVTGPAPFRDRA